MKGKPQDFGAASRILARYGRPHRRWLLIGFAASIGIVAARLAIPWPLRWALEIAVSPETGIPGATGWAAVGDPVLRVMLLYLGIAAVLGVCEMIQRINVGRYAGLLVRDLRAAAVRGAESSGLRSRAHVGDLTAAVIGDSARIKSDLSGILVHATTNGLLFLAVCGVMLWISELLGLIFLVSGAATTPTCPCRGISTHTKGTSALRAATYAALGWFAADSSGWLVSAAFPGSTSCPPIRSSGGSSNRPMPAWPQQPATPIANPRSVSAIGAAARTA